MIDPYSVLGVSPAATQAEITHAYRAQLRNFHPDVRSAESNPGADDRLQQILGAYRLLRDPRRRRDYDRKTARVRISGTPRKIRVNRRDSREDPRTIWVGPVRWQR